MKRIVFVYALLLCGLSLFADDEKVIYSWESTDGNITEQGGHITSNTTVGKTYINYCSSGFYSICLIGKKENVGDDDGSYSSTRFTISLAAGEVFCPGDKIEITAMRNNDDGGEANIYFAFDNGATIVDHNTWANLGQMHEVTINAGTETKGCAGTEAKSCAVSRGGSSTEPLTEYDLYPSANTFIVPETADNASSLTLTRNSSECLLYVTKISVKRSTPTAVNSITTHTPERSSCYDINGRRTPSENIKKGDIIIVNRRKEIR